MPRKRGPVVGDDDPADEISGRLGDEHVAGELRRQPIAAIDHRRIDAGVGRERAVGAQLAGLVAAIHAAVGPHREVAFSSPGSPMNS